MPVQYHGLGLYTNGFQYYETTTLIYNKHSGLTCAYSSLPGEPFPLQRYADVKDDPVWAEYTGAGQYNGSAFSVTLTDDITLVPAWYQGAMFLQEGRLITREEYASGAKVCMISSELAA